jgi:predicted nucleic acid-binding Zn ribbon protein
MPTYEYHCRANGRTVEVSHKLADRIRTWGDFCRRAAATRHCGAPARGSSAFD